MKINPSTHVCVRFSSGESFTVEIIFQQTGEMDLFTNTSVKKNPDSVELHGKFIFMLFILHLFVG